MGPIQDLAQFVPVIHLVKIHLFHRGTGDDHAVVVVVPNFGKLLIESIQVLLGGIFGGVGHGLQKIHLDLQRGIGKTPEDLGLGGDFGGHQV